MLPKGCISERVCDLLLGHKLLNILLFLSSACNDLYLSQGTKILSLGLV